MGDWRPLIDPMKVPASDPAYLPSIETCWIVCCRVWPTRFGAHLKANRCKFCGKRPHLLLTDGEQVKLAESD